MQASSSNNRIEPTWAARVRTGNKQHFEYENDFEVTVKFLNNVTREEVYKEVKKVNWPIATIVGIVMRPGNLVDFTLKTKENAVKMAESLRNSENIRDVVAHADSVSEVRIGFIPPRFPSEPIIEYLTSKHGQVLHTPIRISDRFNIQTGTRVFKMERKSLETNPIASFLYFGKYKFRVRYSGQPTTCGYCAEEGHIERECEQKTNMIQLRKRSKLFKRQAPDEQKEEDKSQKPSYEEAKEAFNSDNETSVPSNKTKPGECESNINYDNERPKRNRSGTNSSTERDSRRHKGDSSEMKPLSSLFDPHSSTSSSDEFEFDTINLNADSCCRGLIKKCKGEYFACACERRFYKCKCGWKLVPPQNGVFLCKGCSQVVANCHNCEEFVSKKKKQLKCQCGEDFKSESKNPSEY